MQLWACLVGGAAMVISGICLFRLRPPDWQSESQLAAEANRKVVARWSGFQRALRMTNNILIAIIGVAIMASPFVQPGKPWLLTWISILLLLLLCVLLAMLDAFSSLAGYRRVLPEVARQQLGNDEN